MKVPYWIIFLVCSVFLYSCHDNRKDQIIHLVNEWQGKEIIFPDSIIFTRYMKDTIDYQIPLSEYKVLIYVDSIGCTSCKLQLNKWKELIQEVDSLTGKQVPFLFFMHTKDKKEMDYLLRRDKFELPVCIDTDNTLDKLNNFPSESSFQTFLLDKENKVCIIGNPVHNLAIKELYIKEVTTTLTKSTSDNEIKTSASIDKNEVNMGLFKSGETKTTSFLLKNTGKNPLVILDASITCGCGKVIFEKHPATPGESLKVTVEMTPEKNGFFNETITLKANTEEMIKLNIKGNVE